MSISLESEGCRSTMISVPRVQQLPQIARAYAPKHTVLSSTFVTRGSVGWIKLQLSSKSVHTRWQQASSCGPRACAAAAEGDDEPVLSRGATLLMRDLQTMSFVGAKFTTKLLHHTADAAWFLGKWIAVPALILMAFREVVSTVLAAEELWIPAGLLAGTIFTGILKETFSSLGIDFQHSILPWHLVLLGIFFVIVKVQALKIGPLWFQVFLLHFTTGSLWQTMRFALDWKAKQKQFDYKEVNSVSV